jgi:hypothetical protein
LRYDLNLEQCRRLGHQLKEQGLNAWDYGDTVYYGIQILCVECQQVGLWPTNEEGGMLEQMMQNDSEEEEKFQKARTEL